MGMAQVTNQLQQKKTKISLYQLCTYIAAKGVYVLYIINKMERFSFNLLRTKHQYNGFANHEQYYNNNLRMLWAMKLG